MSNKKMIDILNAKNELLKLEIESRSKEVSEKKTNRINLWVTKTFYDDIRTILPAFEGKSIDRKSTRLNSSHH